MAHLKKTFTRLVTTAWLATLIFTVSTPLAHANFLSCILEQGPDLRVCLESSESDATSFTDFEGGLTAPSTEGYDPGLVQAQDAREFIIQVTNFILGFLGLIAVVVIIYGGFLYVTAAGAEEQSSKGRKSISYALIGIIIILGSFAVVNTILRAPQGDDRLAGAALEGGPGGVGTAEDQNQARRALFNFASSKVQTIAFDFATAYQLYDETTLDIIELNNIPRVEEAEELHTLLSSKRRIVENISRRAGTFSQVNEVTDQVISVLDKYLRLSQEALAEDALERTKWYEFWDDGARDLELEIKDETGERGLSGANDADFAFAIIQAKDEVKELREQISEVAVLPNVEAAFQAVIDELNALATQIGTTTSAHVPELLLPRAHAQVQFEYVLEKQPTNADILRILQLMADLNEQVADILFVAAIISSDVTEGSAPLLVSFDGLRSVDPTNQTVDRYEWDFGETEALLTLPSSESIDPGSGPSGARFGLDQTTGPSVLHVFRNPGTYVVKLTVHSTTPDQVAPGVAFKRIIVRDPVNKIHLSASVGGEEFPLRQYDSQTGNLVIDQDILKVTPSEAASGIIFDASETQHDRIQSIRWNFGDGTPELIGTAESLPLSQEHQYLEPGTYQLILEVTDVLNNTDRKIVNIVVGSPIARITAKPGTQLLVNETFTLDGSTSSSDSGQITSWQWTTDDIPYIEIDSISGQETFQARYTEPGFRGVTLEVTDSFEQTDTESITLFVQSKAPVAQYNYTIPKTTQPSTVAFNGKLSYDPDGPETELEYLWEVDGETSGENFAFVNNTSETSAEPYIKFSQKGSYTVTLTVIDPNGLGDGGAQESMPFEQEINITNLLDIAWGTEDSPATTVKVDEATGQAQAKIDLTIISDAAVAYEIDWGDGEVEGSTMQKRRAVSHNYNEAGTYIVKASVFDEEDQENSNSRKIFIGSSSVPVAIASIAINGEQIFDTTSVITVNRKDTITFDGGKSLNTDGTGRRLQYSWDFDNGKKSTQAKTNQQFKELGTYDVTLKVTNASDVTQVSPEDKVTIKVVGEPPFLRSITAVPVESELTTPVSVTVTAIGAEDPDGQITRYRWWYYDPNNDDDQLGIQVTPNNTANLNIGTRGLEGEEKTYKFAVEITDDENNTISSRDLLPEAQVATLEVTNGPNKAPVASFNVDRTSIEVGEIINFSSSSKDPDGTITDYYWDFEGDGFADDTESLGANVGHTFTTAAPNGIKVRLKVKDNNESEATSDPVTIFVDGIAADPIAGFTSEQDGTSLTMKFTDTSTPDPASAVAITSWRWDFDITVDSNGDGDKGNDPDSLEQNPTHEYPDYGIYRARLTIEDSESAMATITNFVNVKAPEAAPPPPSELDARLLSAPSASSADGKIHLAGESGTVTFDYSTSIGEITKYVIDKNVLFDTNGNGVKDDDEDHVSTVPGSWTTDFEKAWLPIRIGLTVTDETGKTDKVEKDIVFDSSSPGGPPPGSGGEGSGSIQANTLEPRNSNEIPVLLTLAGLAILSLYFLRRHGQR